MTDFLPTLIVLVLFTWVASRYIAHFGKHEQPMLWVSFIAHQVAGAGNILITRHYYIWGDLLSYHKFGVEAADRLRMDFWSLAPGLVGLIFHRPDPVPIPLETFAGATGAMQGVSGFAAFLLFDSLYAICAVIASIAFLSKVALYTVAREELPDAPRRPLLFACTLLPSALFWSCSLLKEPLAMIGLLFALYGWNQLIKRRRQYQSLLLIGCSSVIIIVIKGYLFPAFCMSVGAWHLARTVQDRRGDIALKTGHVVIATIVVALLVGATGLLLPRFATDTITDQLANLQTAGAAQAQDSGSSYTLGQSAGSAGGQAALAPLALLTALFRPLVFEVKSAIAFVSALEMSGFLIVSIMVLFRRGILGTFSELVRRPFLAFCAVLVVVFGTCVGLGTTNLGTLSRYRMPMLPFFATLLLCLLARPSAPAVDLRAGVRALRRTA